MASDIELERLLAEAEDELLALAGHRAELIVHPRQHLHSDGYASPQPDVHGHWDVFASDCDRQPDP